MPSEYPHVSWESGILIVKLTKARPRFLHLRSPFNNYHGLTPSIIVFNRCQSELDTVMLCLGNR